MRRAAVRDGDVCLRAASDDSASAAAAYAYMQRRAPRRERRRCLRRHMPASGAFDARFIENDLQRMRV